MTTRRLAPAVSTGAFLTTLLWTAAASAQSGGPPFLSGLAAERGVTLPRPWGLGLVYSNVDQDLELDNFVMSANGAQGRSVDFVSIDDSKLKADSLLLKGDVWLFPFLNLFAFVGTSNNDVTGRFSVQGDDLLSFAGSDACTDPNDRPQVCDQTFTGDIDRSADATQYGAGATFAAGRGRAFALLGLLYASSESSDSDTKIDAFSVTPRLGYRFPLEGGGELALYGGASFIDSQVDIRNQVVFPGGPQTEEIVIDYSLTQKNEDDWSYLAGLNWDITRSFTLQGEYSLGAREGLLATLVWRFGGT